MTRRTLAVRLENRRIFCEVEKVLLSDAMKRLGVLKNLLPVPLIYHLIIVKNEDHTIFNTFLHRDR